MQGEHFYYINVLDIEIEEPSPIYDRDTKNDRLTDRLQGLN